jgi:hypothetical protein
MLTSTFLVSTAGRLRDREHVLPQTYRLLHFTVQIISLTSAFSYSSKHRETTYMKDVFASDMHAWLPFAIVTDFV